MPTSMPRTVPVLILGGLALLAACWQRRDAEPADFALVRVHPRLDDTTPPLLLNDAITVYFSEPVDPMSVTRDSVAVVDADGHAVRGRLRVEGTWVTFEPDPPLSAELLDGSLLPDAEYRLSVTGYPCADGVRSARGRLLTRGLQRSFRTAGRDTSHLGLRAPLRPLPGDSRPFLLRPPAAGSMPMPADDPRLQLHFTLPLLPQSVTPAAFALTLVRHRARPGEFEHIEPSAVRLMSHAVDDFPASTVEIEFADAVPVRGSDRTVRLLPDDLVGVSLQPGEQSFLDYAGRAPLMAVQWWYVVPGVAVTVAEWPAEPGARYLDADLATPGFEVVAGGGVQPLVRVEAGDGSLGVFRPRRDTVLVPGEAFDRGDGTPVASHGTVFAFQSIEIPAGVTVRVQSSRTVQLLAQGRVRIDGRLEIAADAPPSTLRAGQLVDISTLRECAAATVLGASGIEIGGAVAAHAASGGSPLALVTAGTLAISGSVPPGSVLATERGGPIAPQSTDRWIAVRVHLQPGLPQGHELLASGFTPFRALPSDRGASVLRFQASDPGVRVAWQVVPGDPRRRGEPDLDPARAAPPREVLDGQRIEAPPGTFLRLRVQARVRGGAPLPRLQSVRALDR
jgi:hypothetical protein